MHDLSLVPDVVWHAYSVNGTTDLWHWDETPGLSVCGKELSRGRSGLAREAATSHYCWNLPCWEQWQKWCLSNGLAAPHQLEKWRRYHPGARRPPRER